MIIQAVVLSVIIKTIVSTTYSHEYLNTSNPTVNVFTSNDHTSVLKLFDLVQKNDDMSFALVNKTQEITLNTQIGEIVRNETVLKDLNITLVDYTQVNKNTVIGGYNNNNLFVLGKKKSTLELQAPNTINSTFSLSHCYIINSTTNVDQAIPNSTMNVTCDSIDLKPIDDLFLDSNQQNVKQFDLFGIQGLEQGRDINLYIGMNYTDASHTKIALVDCVFNNILNLCHKKEATDSLLDQVDFTYRNLIYNPFTIYNDQIFMPIEFKAKSGLHLDLYYYNTTNKIIDTIKGLDSSTAQETCPTLQIDDFKIQMTDIMYLTEDYLCRITLNKTNIMSQNPENNQLEYNIKDQTTLNAISFDSIKFNPSNNIPKGFDTTVAIDTSLIVMVYFELDSNVQVYSWNTTTSNGAKNQYLELTPNLGPYGSIINLINSNCASTFCYKSNFIAASIEFDDHQLKIYENNLSHLYYTLNSTNITINDKTRIAWATESRLFYFNDQSIGVIDLHPEPSIIASKLQKNTTIVLNYTSDPSFTDWSSITINYLIYPDDQKFVQRYPVETLTGFLTQQTTGKFLYESKIDQQNWFMGNNLNFTYKCDDQGVIGNSTIFTEGSMIPRKFNFYQEDLSQDNVFHYHNQMHFIGRSFISIMQISLVININFCSITRSGEVRCSLKKQIYETQAVLQSTFSSKILAYQQQDGWRIYNLNPIFLITELLMPYSFCTVNPADEFSLYCSDMAQKKIKVYLVEPENNQVKVMRTIDNVYASSQRTSETFAGLLFGVSDTFISVIDVYNGVVISKISSPLTADNRFTMILQGSYLLIVCYSRNSFQEYYIGDLSSPIESLPEYSFKNMGFTILNSNGQHDSRKFTNLVPLMATDKDDMQNLIYIKIGEPNFNRILFHKKLYNYREFSNIWLQTTYLPADSVRNQGLEVVSLIDSGLNDGENKSNDGQNNLCNPKKKNEDNNDEDMDIGGNPLACDMIVFHDYRSILDLRNAKKEKCYKCSLDVSTKTNDTTILSVNFGIDVGKYSEKITNVGDKKEVTVIQTFSNDPIPIEKYFDGMVLGYNLDQAYLRSKPKFNIIKLYEWDKLPSQKFVLTREEFKVNALSVQSDNSIYIQTEDMIMKMAMSENTVNTSVLSPIIKSYVHLKRAGEQQRKNCTKIIYDGDSELSFSFCFLSNSLVCVISSFNNRRAKILLESSQTFSAYNNVLKISLMTSTTPSSSDLLNDTLSNDKTGEFTTKTINVFSNKQISNQFIMNSWTLDFPNNINKSELSQKANREVIIENMTADFVKSIVSKDLKTLDTSQTPNIVDADNQYVVLFNSKYIEQDKGGIYSDASTKPLLKIYSLEYHHNNSSIDTIKKHELLSVDLQDILKSKRYNFFGLIKMECENNAFKYDEDDFKYYFGENAYDDLNKIQREKYLNNLTNQAYYFSCILVQSDGLHFEILFSIEKGQKIKYDLVTYYVQYTSFKAKTTLSISTKYFAITGEKNFYINSKNFDYPEDTADQLPPVYLLTYKRLTKDETSREFNGKDFEQRYEDVKNYYSLHRIVNTSKIFVQQDYNILEEYKKGELYNFQKQRALHKNPKSIQIEGGVSVLTRSPRSKLSIKFKNYMEENYLISAGFLHNPINFYKLNDLISATSKDIFKEDFNVTAFNHFSQTTIKIISENPLIVWLKWIVFSLAVLIVLSIFLCIFIRKCRSKKTDQEHQIEKLKEGIDSDDDEQNQQALGMLQEEEYKEERETGMTIKTRNFGKGSTRRISYMASKSGKSTHKSESSSRHSEGGKFRISDIGEKDVNPFKNLFPKRSTEKKHTEINQDELPLNEIDETRELYESKAINETKEIKIESPFKANREANANKGLFGWNVEKADSIDLKD